jgi:hypothetical protein
MKTAHLCLYEAKLSNLKLKSWAKQLLASLLIEITLPDRSDTSILYSIAKLPTLELNSQPSQLLGYLLLAVLLTPRDKLKLSAKARNTKGGSITVPFTSCLAGLESAV